MSAVHLARVYQREETAGLESHVEAQPYLVRLLTDKVTTTAKASTPAAAPASTACVALPVSEAPAVRPAGGAERLRYCHGTCTVKS
jgi:hypothetical protein